MLSWANVSKLDFECYIYGTYRNGLLMLNGTWFVAGEMFGLTLAGLKTVEVVLNTACLSVCAGLRTGCVGVNEFDVVLIP